MNKQDIKVGMLVRASFKTRYGEEKIGMIVGYPGGEWIFVLYGDKIVSWNIGFCEPLGI